MRPFHFGPAGRRLFGVWHPPRGVVASRRAVLICGPFGQDAVRLHRFLRVLATRLSDAGVGALRFDYFGAGDSDGDDLDLDLDGMYLDVRTAHAELMSCAGDQATAWFGAGLGGTACLLASGEGIRPSRIVVWNPVIDGGEYLRALRRRHVESLEASYSLPDPQWRRRLDAYNAEASGFELSTRLRAQLKAMNGAGTAAPSGSSIDIVVDDDSYPRAVAWVDRHCRHITDIRVTRAQEAVEWNPDDFEGTPLVPPRAIAQLVDLLVH